MQQYDVELIVWVQVKDQSTSGTALAKGELKRSFVGISVTLCF